MGKKRDISEDEALGILGLDPEKWTLQFDDEQLRMLQEIVRAEEVRRKAVFAGLLDNIESFGS